MDSTQEPLTLPEGYVVDFIDGTLRRDTAEEYVRQNVERSLVREYSYERSDIAVEFLVKVGSSRRRVDIAVFPPGSVHRQENILLIVECKKEGTKPGDKKEGVEQLKSYLAASINARYGLWTNGSNERIALEKVLEAKDPFAVIVDIPLQGQETPDQTGVTKLHLRPATGDNLLLAFKRCHNFIAGNQGLQKPEAFRELLKIIFCKIEDERSLRGAKFFVTGRERSSTQSAIVCKKRIDGLFIDVRKKFPAIFGSGEQIELNAEVTTYVVQQLQIYSLLDSTVDVKGVAYEEIVGANLRGDRGEFFTPRNACRMAVDLLDPNPGDRICDPACGTGGFLITGMHKILGKFDEAKQAQWRDPENPSQAESFEFYRARNELLARDIIGLDINPLLVHAAKMNMVMNNDGSGGITQADSLRNPHTWSQEAHGLVSLGTFDFVFTNPPFGTKIRIDSPEVLRDYDLGVLTTDVGDAG